MTDFAQAFPQTEQHEAITEATARKMLREVDLERALQVAYEATPTTREEVEEAHSAIWARLDELLAGGVKSEPERRVWLLAARALAMRVRAGELAIREGAHQSGIKADSLAPGFYKADEGPDVGPGEL